MKKYTDKDMKKNNIRKRTLVVLLSIFMIFAMMPIIPGVSDTETAWAGENYGTEDIAYQLEYIESDGGQYINTGVTAGPDCRVVMDYQLVEEYQDDKHRGLFGAREGSNRDDDQWVFAYRIEHKYRVDYYMSKQDENVENSRHTLFDIDLDRHTVDYNQNVLSFDGNVVHTFEKKEYDVNGNLYLFAINTAGEAGSSMIAAKLFSCRIYKENELVRDYIPYSNNGEIGLWDKVNDKFYGNAGTGAFTLGVEYTIYSKKWGAGDIIAQATEVALTPDSGYMLYNAYMIDDTTGEIVDGAVLGASGSSGEQKMTFPEPQNDVTIETSFGPSNGVVKTNLEFPEEVEKNISKGDQVLITVNGEYTYSVRASQAGSFDPIYLPTATSDIVVEYKGNAYLASEAAKEDGTITVTDNYQPVTTYDQYSAGEENNKKNNDPLLVIGTVKGLKGYEAPEGNIFFMFSGSLTDSAIDGYTADPESYYEENVAKRVMDTPNYTLVGEEGSQTREYIDPATVSGDDLANYNGYDQLIKSNLSLTKTGENWDEDGQFWTQIPEELKCLRVRVSLGGEASALFKSDATGNGGFTSANLYEGNWNDAPAGTYKVTFTYEWITIDNGGTEPALGELLELDPGTQTTYSLVYDDVEVLRKTAGGEEDLSGEYTWAKGEAGYIDPAAAGITEPKVQSFAKIKEAILTNLNDGDSGNDWWNLGDEYSFGVYITYEYIANNICYAKYVPEGSQSYGVSDSEFQVLYASRTPHQLTNTVYKRKAYNADGTEVKDSDWTKVSEDENGYFNVDYRDAVKIVTEDSAKEETPSPTGSFRLAIGEGAKFGKSDGQETGEFVLTPDIDANRNGTENLQITIARLADGQYQYTTEDVKVKIAKRVDVEKPIIKPTESVLVLKGTVTLTRQYENIFTESETRNGRETTYQWYVGIDGDFANASQIGGATDESYTFTNDVTEPTTKYYFVKATNTDTNLNGTQTETTVSSPQEVKLLNAAEVPAPKISKISGKTENKKGQPANPLTIEVANTSPYYKTTIIWYMDVEDGEDQKVGEGKVFFPNTDNAGSYKYYAVAVNEFEGNVINAATEESIKKSSRSETVTVKVKASSGGSSKYPIVAPDPDEPETNQPETGEEIINDSNVMNVISKSILMVRTKYEAKGNVKATVICEGTDFIKKVEEAGYRVEYNFYRSESKRKGYELRLTKKVGNYINTIGKKNTMYYYRVKLAVYNKDGKLIGETKLLKCRYGNRIWKSK